MGADGGSNSIASGGGGKPVQWLQLALSFVGLALQTVGSRLGAGSGLRGDNTKQQLCTGRGAFWQVEWHRASAGRLSSTEHLPAD